MYLFAPVAFVMKVTALHLWSIFTPKSGANAKEREGRMHFGVAQRFAALIAGVRQMSLKLSAKAAAGLPRSVRGYAGLWRGIALQGQGACSFLSQDCLAVSGGMQACGAGWSRNVGGFVLCTERRAFICFRGAGAHRGACVLRLSSARVDHLGSDKRLHDQVQRL